MSAAGEGGHRDRDTIEYELRRLADVRSAHRERGTAMPSSDQIDALLDELLEVGRGGKHRWENRNPDASPSLWR